MLLLTRGERFARLLARQPTSRMIATLPCLEWPYRIDRCQGGSGARPWAVWQRDLFECERASGPPVCPVGRGEQSLLSKTLDESALSLPHDVLLVDVQNVGADRSWIGLHVLEDQKMSRSVVALSSVMICS